MVAQFITLNEWTSSQTQMQAILQQVPQVLGFCQRYRWADLEPAGYYEFGRLQSDMHWAAARGLKLVPMVMDKSFKDVGPAPEYLSQYELPNAGNGYTVMRWQPEVATAFDRLVQRICHFSGDPAWAGIMFVETALSLTDAQLKAAGYTAQKFADTYMRQLRKSVLIYWQANYFRGDQSQIMKIVNANANVKLGGPDCWPTNDALQRQTYPIYRQYTGNFIGMSVPAYDQPGYTIEQTARYGIDNLHCDTLFWTYVPNFTQQAAAIKKLHSEASTYGHGC